MRYLATIFLISILTLGAYAKDRVESPAPQKKNATTHQYQATYRQPSAEAYRGRWLASGGIGLWFDPSLFLLSPQLEYAMRHNFYIGPMVQLGLGSGTLFTASCTGRFLIGQSRVKPTLEAGLGMAVASGGAVGLHLPIGVGMDYQLEHGISVGTIIRGNFLIGSSFANAFSVSWPILVGRFAI